MRWRCRPWGSWWYWSYFIQFNIEKININDDNEHDGGEQTLSWPLAMVRAMLMMNKLKVKMNKLMLMLFTLIWPLAMVRAAPDVKPAITGWEMKSIKKPSLKWIMMIMMMITSMLIHYDDDFKTCWSRCFWRGPASSCPWWLWSLRQWSCWISWQDDDEESVPEVSADEDDDASEKGEKGGVVDSVGLHPEEICNEHRGFKR